MTRLDRKTPDRADVIDQDLARLLLKGLDYFDQFADWEDADLRQAWGLIAEHVMPQWVAELPGSRPWAWWRFNAPERRRQLAGPSCAARPASWFGIPTPYHFSCRFETEGDYLRRLRLLAPGEELAVKAPESAGDPEAKRREALEAIVQLFPE